MIGQSLLFACLAVVFPVWGFFQGAHLKRSQSVHARTRAYWQTLAALCAAAAAAVALAGFRNVVTIVAPPGLVLSPDIVAPLLVGLTVGIAVPIVLLKIRPRSAAATPVAKQLTGLQWFLPITPGQRNLWVLLSITAGVCEEVLFRGFSLHYLLALPVNMPLLAAILIASFVFSLSHLYQGVAGVIGTAFLSVLLALLFVLTGNLATPIAIHTLVDLRVLLLRPAA